MVIRCISSCKQLLDGQIYKKITFVSPGLSPRAVFVYCLFFRCWAHFLKRRNLWMFVPSGWIHNLPCGVGMKLNVPLVGLERLRGETVVMASGSFLKKACETNVKFRGFSNKNDTKKIMYFQPKKSRRV